MLVMRAEHRDHGLLDYASDLREDGWQLDAIVEVAPAGPQRLLRWDGERFSEAPMERAEIAEVRARALGPERSVDAQLDLGNDRQAEARDAVREPLDPLQRPRLR